MLFNSHIFIFVFLPLTLVILFGLNRLYGKRAAIVWLVAASLFFYGWWNPKYVFIILASIGFNYAIGKVISQKQTLHAKGLMLLGVAGNLTLLGYSKYANFFMANWNTLTGNSVHLEKIVLPLAISFFTFDQIAYLLDSYQGRTVKHDFWSYCLLPVSRI